MMAGVAEQLAGLHGDKHRESQDDAAGAVSARKVQSTQHQEVGHRREISTTFPAVR